MEDKILEQVAQRYDTNEATVCAEIEYTWEDIQNIADPLLRRYWGLGALSRRFPVLLARSSVTSRQRDTA